jgi:hypothetical protein
MALGWLGDFLGINKGNATVDAAGENRDIVTEYGNTGRRIINRGANEAEGYLTNILGLSGYTPGQDPREAFTASPGYDFQMDQGLQALDRRAAASGRFSSGNADLDTLKFSQGLASQDWNQWLDRVTGGLGGLANLSTGTANARLGLEGDVASGLTSANNMMAGGQEANQGWGMNLLSNVAKIGGSFMGYGGF